MPAVAPKPDALRAAKNAGLRYVSDDGPGIRRVASGKRFRYHDDAGKAVTDGPTLGRIKRLAIPPAWSDVWICPRENGHIQATGRDARGRKQYRYHSEWRAVRDASKYERTLAFAEALPRIRRRIAQDLKQPGLGRDKVLATMVRLLETTLIRVGNDEYAKANGSFGLSTLRDKHVQIRQNTLRFSFKGKSGKYHEIELRDPRLAKIVRGTQDLPGQELFQYVDEQGETRDVTSDDVNTYLRQIAGAEFSAKDFRTWAGTVLAAIALAQFDAFETKKQAKKNLVAAIEGVSQRLGNTPAVCRKCYIHPSVVDSYLEGNRIEALRSAAGLGWTAGGPPAVRETPPFGIAALSPCEKAVLSFLRAQLKRPANPPDLTEALTRSVARLRGDRGRGRAHAHAPGGGARAATRSPGRKSPPSGARRQR